MTPEQLFNDYAFYRNNTSNIRQLKKDKPYIKDLKYNKVRHDLFLKMMDWCMVKKVPVRQWLYTLFVVRCWRFAPKLEESHLCSEKHLPKFYKVKNYDFYNKYITEDVKTKTGFDPNMDIVTSVEQRKRELVLKGGGLLCMKFMEKETYGYHPKSSVCKVCGDWYQCSNKLLDLVGFEVMKLRTG